MPKRRRVSEIPEFGRGSVGGGTIKDLNRRLKDLLKRKGVPKSKTWVRGKPTPKTT
jgi:hypothetical protein